MVTTMFLTCPAYLDADKTVRCGLPAEVRCRFTMRSTDGLLESAMIRCPAGHHYSGPIESLTSHPAGSGDPGTAAARSRALCAGLQGSHDGRDGGSGSALRDLRGTTERKARRPNTAPAYYLGHPAGLWMAVMRSHREVIGAAAVAARQTLSYAGR